MFRKREPLNSKLCGVRAWIAF